MSVNEYIDARSVYEFTVKKMDGEEISMEIYKGFVLLIVNVASRCGFTANNYKDLVYLDKKYRALGLRILAFPCNQFFNQEPGTNEDVVCFARSKNATFDFFDKIEVNGKNAHPLYKYLKSAQRGTLSSAIKWNFTKFIVDRMGKPVERHAPYVPPATLCNNIEAYLRGGSPGSKKSWNSKASKKEKRKEERDKKKWAQEEKELQDRLADHNAHKDGHILTPG